LSNKVRRGEQINVNIPSVGQLKIKDGIAGVIFNNELLNPGRI
jgi:hypothetical protein